MKLTIELPDDLAEHLRAATQRNGSLSTVALAYQAIENEVERAECGCSARCDHRDLTDLARQIQNLEKGQRAIVALVDSSATILAALLRGRNPRR